VNARTINTASGGDMRYASRKETLSFLLCSISFVACSGTPACTSAIIVPRVVYRPAHANARRESNSSNLTFDPPRSIPLDGSAVFSTDESLRIADDSIVTIAIVFPSIRQNCSVKSHPNGSSLRYCCSATLSTLTNIRGCSTVGIASDKQVADKFNARKFTRINSSRDK